jgi:hypothetical protein
VLGAGDFEIARPKGAWIPAIADIAVDPICEIIVLGHVVDVPLNSNVNF